MNNRSPSLEERILRQLEQLQTALGQLAETLSREHEILRRTDPEALERVTREKGRSFEQLDTLLDGLFRQAGEQGFSSDPAGVQELFDQHPKRARLLDIWGEILDLSRRCQEQNEINGGIVTLNRRLVTQTLDILHGISTDNRTYGRDGESSRERAGSILAKV